MIAPEVADTIIRAAPVMIVLLDAEGRIQFTNPHVEKVSGFGADELRGKDWFTACCSPEEREREVLWFRRALSGDSERDHVHVASVITRSGEECVVEWRTEVRRDDTGSVTGALCIGYDVTERVRTERALRANIALLNGMVDCTRAFVAACTPDGIRVETNRVPLDATGLDRTDVIGKPVWDAYWWSYSPAAQEQVRAAVRRAAAGETVRQDFLARAGADRFITLDLTLAPLRDQEGRVVYVVTSGVDVSGRVRAERESESARAMLQAVVDTSPDYIFAKDSSHRYVFANRRFSQAMGLPPEQIFGRPDTDFWAPELCIGDLAKGIRGFRVDDAEVLAGQTVDNSHVPGTFPTGQAGLFDTIKIPLRDAEGRIDRILGYSRDMTPQRRAEEALRVSEGRLQEAQRIAKLGSWEVDVETNAVTWSDELFRILELEPSQVRPSVEILLTLVHPDDRRKVNAAIAGFQSTGQPWEVVYRVCTRTGIKRLHERSEPVRGADGVTKRVIGTILDVTARYRVAEALEAARDQLAATLHAIPDSLFELDEEGRYLAIRSQGPTSPFRPEQLLGRTVREVLPAESAQSVLDAVRESSVTGASFGHNYRVPVPGGDRWFELSVARKPVREGRSHSHVVVSRDVTDRMGALEAIAESEQFFHAIFDGASVGLLILQERKALRVNDAFANLLGYTKEELIGMGKGLMPSVTFHQDREQSGSLMDEIRAGSRSTFRFEKRYVHRDGRVIWAIVKGTRLPTSEDEAVRTLLQILDITGRKHSEEALKRALDEKSLLLREVHHRVKNNLQLITSLLYLQGDHAKDARILAHFTETRARVRAIAMIHDLLSDSGHPGRVDFAAYLRNVVLALVAGHESSAGAPTTTVDGTIGEIDIQLAIPCGLIVNELVTNVLKHAFPQGRGGEIRISCGRDAEGCCVLSVADDGVGLPPALDPTRSRGLGLPLVCTLAKQIDATMRIDGSIGTRFEFTFTEPSPVSYRARELQGNGAR